MEFWYVESQKYQCWLRIRETLTVLGNALVPEAGLEVEQFNMVSIDAVNPISSYSQRLPRMIRLDVSSLAASPLPDNQDGYTRISYSSSHLIAADRNDSS
jgi:hypothetical protein